MPPSPSFLLWSNRLRRSQEFTGFVHNMCVCLFYTRYIVVVLWQYNNIYSTAFPTVLQNVFHVSTWNWWISRFSWSSSSRASLKLSEHFLANSRTGFCKHIWSQRLNALLCARICRFLTTSYSERNYCIVFFFSVAPKTQTRIFALQFNPFFSPPAKMTVRIKCVRMSEQ